MNNRTIGAVFLCLAFFACQRDPNREGQRLYAVHCANCHGEEGVGLGALIPPLVQSDYMTMHRQQLPCIIKYGLADTITVNGKVYAGEPMPSNGALSEIQIANILNFIGSKWENKIENFSIEEVRTTLKACSKQ